MSHQCRSHMTNQMDVIIKMRGKKTNLAGNFTWLCVEKLLIISPGGAGKYSISLIIIKTRE